jgi:Collagen triple helix repeat (20 copies)
MFGLRLRILLIVGVSALTILGLPGLAAGLRPRAPLRRAIRWNSQAGSPLPRFAAVPRRRPCAVRAALGGDRGPRGHRGFTGARGLTGLTGARGLTGLTGAAGTVGVQGLQGIQGFAGLTGLGGSQGLQGIDGLQGIAGL